MSKGKESNVENIVVMGKEIREMSSMTETNSVNIMSLVALIKSQNKSLQNLQRQVSILKDRIPEESDSDTDVEEISPRLPKSAYMFFCESKRSEVKDDHPDWKMTEIAKELGRMWKEDFPTDEHRNEFIALSSEDKERYAREKAKL
jgi:hypothetical protein